MEDRMPAIAPDATRVSPAARADDHWGRRDDAALRDNAVRQWSEMANALTVTDEDDVPLFGRLPA
jgi:hypothetical protein